MARQRIGVEAVFDVTQFNQGLQVYLKGMIDAERATDQAARSVSRAGDLIAVGFGGALGAATIYQIDLIINALRRLGQEALETVRFFERLQFSMQSIFAIEMRREGQFDTINEALSEADRIARAYILTLQDIAIFSPFTTEQVGTAFQLLSVYGFAREEALKLTEALVDTASATGRSDEQLRNIAYAMGQIRAEQRLLARDAMQLTTAGIQVYDALMEHTGMTWAELQEQQRRGNISSQVTFEALIKWMAEFDGAGVRVSKTLNGLLSSLADLQQITFKDFFSAVFEPILPVLEEMVDLFKDPEFTASVSLLGQLIGVQLANAINFARKLVLNFTESFAGLSPQVIQAALAFGFVATSLTALAAAAGITFLAVNLLINPFTLLVVAMSSFAAAYVTNFANIGTATNTFLNTLGNMVDIAGRTLDELVGNFSTTVTNIGNMLADLSEAATNWGINIVNSIASGMIGAINTVIEAISILGSVMTFWLAPGSPPRFLPLLDVWGKEAAQVYLDGWTDADFAIISEVGSQISKILTDMFKGSNLPTIDFDRLVRESFHAFALAIDELKNAGEISTEALNRIRDAAGPAGDALIELAKSYERIFKSSNLSKIALENTSQLLEMVSKSFTSDDFNSFSQFGGAIAGLIEQLADLGQIKEIDVPGLIIGSRDVMSNVINDLRTFGKVSDTVFSQIEASPVADKLLDFAKAYEGIVAASTEVTKAQDQFTEAQEATNLAQEQLNTTLQVYDRILEPLRNSLTEATEDSTLADEAKEIRQLQRLIASGATDATQKEEARLKIAKIQATQRVRALEAERDAVEESGKNAVNSLKTEEELARERLTAAQQYQNSQQEQLNLLLQKINLETETLGIYNQQMDLFEDQQRAIEDLFKTQEDLIAELQKSYLDAMDKLNKERDRANAKMLAPLDRALKLFQLQQEELASLLKIAKARHTLASAESTEYEKQNAALIIQTELAKRLKREKDFIELGGDITTLERLRAVNITLEDILGKGKAGGDSPLAGVVDDLEIMADHDPLAQLEEWEKAMASVSERFAGIATSVNTALTTLNDSLPSFLKFQTVAGETAPILRLLGGTFAYMTTSLVASKIVSSLKTIGSILVGTASKSNILIGVISTLAAVWVSNFGDIQGKTRAVINQVQGAMAAFQVGMKTRVGQFASIAGGIRFALLSLIPEDSKEMFTGFLKNIDNVGKAMDAFVLGFQNSSNALDGIFFGMQFAISRLFPKETADRIIGFMNSVRDSIKFLIDTVKSFISSPLDFKKIFNLEGFETFEDFISSMPQWVQDSFDKITSTVTTFRDKFVGILTAILRLAGVNLGALLVIFQNNLKIISSAIAGVGLSILKVFAGDFEGAKQTLQSTLTTIVGLFQENLGKALEAVNTARLAIVLSISGIAGPIFSRLATLARGGLGLIMTEVGKFGTEIITMIPSFFTRALSVTAKGIGAGSAVVFNAIANTVSAGISGALFEALTRFREFLLALSKISVIDSVMASARTSIKLVVDGFFNLYYAVTSVWQRAITFLDIMNVRIVESIASVINGLGKFGVKFVGFIQGAISTLSTFNVRFVGFMERVVGAIPLIIEFAIQIGKVWKGAFELALVGIVDFIQRITGLGKSIGISKVAFQGFIVQVLELGRSIGSAVEGVLPTVIGLFNRFKGAASTAFATIIGIIRGSQFAEVMTGVRASVEGVGEVSKALTFNPLRSLMNLIRGTGSSVSSLLASIGNALTGVATAANEVKVTAAIRGFINFIVDIFANGIRGVTTITRGFFNLLSVFKPSNIISAFSAIFRSVKTIGSAIGGLLNPLNLVLFAIDFFAFAWDKTISGVGKNAVTLGDTIKQAWADLISGKIWRDIVDAVSPWMIRLGEVWQDVQQNGFDSEVLKTFLTDLGNTIVENLQSIGAKMWESIVTFWAPTFWEWVKESVINLVTELTAMLLAIGAWLQNAGVLIKAKFTEEWIPAFVDWWTENDVSGQITTLLNSAWTAISEWIVSISENIYTKFTDEWLPNFVDWVSEVAPQLTEKLNLWVSGIGAWITENGPVLAEKFLDWAIEFVEWLGPATTQAYKKLGEWAGAILKWLIGVGFPTIIGGTVKLIGALVNWISGNEDSADNKVGEKLGLLFSAISSYVTDHLVPAIITLFADVANGMWQGIVDAWALIDWETLGTTITEGAKGLGQNMIDGMKEGFNSKVDDLKSGFTSGIDSALQGAKNLLGIQSPSTVTAALLGVPMAQGVVAGWQSELTNSESTSSSYLLGWVNSLFTDTKPVEDQGIKLGNTVVGAFQGTVTDGEEKTTNLLSTFANRVAVAAAEQTGTGIVDAVRSAVDLVQLVLEFVRLGSTIATAVKEGVDSVGEPLADWMREQVSEAVIALQIGIGSVETVATQIVESLRDAIDVDVLKKSGDTIVNNFIKSLSTVIAKLVTHNESMDKLTLDGANLVIENFTTLRENAIEQIEILYDDSITWFTDIKDELIRITGEMSAELIAIYDAMKLSLIGIIDALETDVTDTFADIRTDLNTEFNLMKEDSDRIFTSIKDSAILIMDDFYKGVVGKATDTKDGTIDEIDKILEHFNKKETRDSWYESGKELGYALADGIWFAIRDKVEAIKRAAADLANAAIEGAREAADAASPSKRMIEEVGQPLVDGILVPMENGIKDAKSLSQKLINGAMANLLDFPAEWEGDFGNPFDSATQGALQLIEVTYELQSAFKSLPSMVPNSFKNAVLPTLAFSQTAQTGLNAPLSALIEPRVGNGVSNVYYGPTSYTTNNYNLGVYTSQTPEVVQRSFAIMEVLSS